MKTKEETIQSLQKAAGLKARQREQTFANYVVKDGNRAAYETAKAFGKYSKGLYLAGVAGCGKTFTAAAIANSEIAGWYYENSDDYRHGFLGNPTRIMFTSTIDMLAAIRAAYDSDDDAQDVINKYSGAKLLVLDDVGTEKLTEWAYERIFEVIDHRYNEELQTIITSNLAPKQLKSALGDRLLDRIREMCRFVTITEPSQRTTAQ